MRMRKLLAMLLALTMVLSGSVMAFAEDEDEGPAAEPLPVAETTGEYSEDDIEALAEIIIAHRSELPQNFTADKTSDDWAEWDDGWWGHEFIVFEGY